MADSCVYGEQSLHLEERKEGRTADVMFFFFLLHVRLKKETEPLKCSEFQSLLFLVSYKNTLKFCPSQFRRAKKTFKVRLYSPFDQSQPPCSHL